MTPISRFRLPNMSGTNENDWHEDFSHENGEYFCVCLGCGVEFVGHKRRHICRKCHMSAKAKYDALTLEEKTQYDEQRDKEIKDFFKKKKKKRIELAYDCF